MNVEEYFGENTYEFDTEEDNEVNELMQTQSDFNTTFEEGFNESGGEDGLDEIPVFSLEKVEYKPNRLRHLVVSNNILLMALGNNHVIRINLESPEDIEDIEISRKADDTIRRVFLDPTGKHALVSMESEENYYLHISSRKPKILPKMKSILIESVAWDYQNQDPTTTKNILIGTNQGKIYDVILEHSEKRFAELVGVGKDQYIKHVYTLHEPQPITGIRFELFPGDQNKYFIVITTPTRIHQCIGSPTLEAVFTNLTNSRAPPAFHELPGDISKSEISFYGRPGGVANSFAWITGPGIYHGDLVFGSQHPGDHVVSDAELLPYPLPARFESPPPGGYPPISLVLTKYHYLLLYETTFQVISKLSEQVTYEYELNPSFGQVHGLAFDPVNHTIWAFTEHTVFEVVISGEDRNIWRLYLQKGMWPEAIAECGNDTSEACLKKKNIVWTAQAKHYFEEEKYELAAIYYAKTGQQFEEIALKFINCEKRDSLKTFLVQKLENIRDKKKNATQTTLICTWLVEIYLNKLNELWDMGQYEQLEELKTEVHQFFTDWKDHLNHRTTFDLITSHGRMEEMLYFASVIKDFERAISFYIQQNDYLKAIATLSRLPEEQAELFYKFSPTLFLEFPEQMVDCWIRCYFLDPKRLLPALVRYEQTNSDLTQSIRYLNHCVQTCNVTDMTVHNYLISLYAQLPDEHDLLVFLSQPVRHYDLKYTLRLCTKLGLRRPCVLIYSAMELYEEAVDLAILVDLELAKQNADKPDDEALRKKLWLKIAHHVVKEKNDIKAAVDFLRHCNLLKIEDILPFFPDFTLIDSFKDEICRSLQEYNIHIDELKDEMDEATLNAQLIRRDISELRNKYGFVSANKDCDLCHFSLLTRGFYFFPCGHVFHTDCILRKVVPSLSKTDRELVESLESQLSILRNEPEAIQGEKRSSLLSLRNLNPEPASSASTSIAPLGGLVSNQERLRSQLDSLIASECVFCGELMIREISKSFIDESENQTVLKWLI